MSAEMPTGEIVSDVEAGIDGPGLISDGVHIKASVRQELALSESPLMLEPFLEAVMRGCEYLFAQALTSQEVELSAALDLSSRYEKEYHDNGARSMVFITVTGTATHDGIETEWIENEAAVTVRRILPQCRALVADGPLTVHLEDLQFSPLPGTSSTAG